jgi:hypothetical protein
MPLRELHLFHALGLGLLVTASTAATAAEGDPPPKAFADVIACRSIADTQERLACFDATVAELEGATDSKTVVVLSGEEVKETRRGLFGLSLPRIGLFKGDNDDEESLREITSTITKLSGGTGQLVVTLDDGSVWEQTDGAFTKRPAVGQTIVIKRAAFGSYMGRINNGAAFRVKRRS